MPDHPQFNIDRTYPGRWTITFNNPPINMFVPTTIVEFGALMTDLEADPSVKVVVFQSANPDFFIAHLDVAKAVERPEVLGLWRDSVLRLASTPVVSIAKIRGRTRALEFLLSGDDFDADIAERYGWVNRTLDDKDLDSFVDALVRRLASFDREALGAVKAQVNRFGTPTATELKSSTDIFFSALAWPGQLKRRGRVRTLGYGVPSDFEFNFGRYLPTLGRADDDDTDTQPH
jgi:enoyl-CoA hydratase/carnithine racemase